MELIEDHSQQRARNAFKCLPLNSIFYSDIQSKGLNASTVFNSKENYCVIGCKWFKSTSEVETTFRWLITIGILRREVDGQGLTSKVRITPLGRKVFKKNPTLFKEGTHPLKKILICFKNPFIKNK